MSLTRVLTRPRVGMGEHPGFYCYDANRPSWLPYWWDTWGESVCKLKAVPGNIAACLNPFDPNCASTSEPGSWVNVREAAGLPVADLNVDPTVSGPGIAEEGEATNAPPQNPMAPLFWLAIAMGTVLVASYVFKK